MEETIIKKRVQVSASTMAHHLRIAAERYREHVEAMRAVTEDTPMMTKAAAARLATQFQEQADEAEEMAGALSCAVATTLCGEALVIDYEVEE
jgi:hypothetical protein